MVRTETSLAAGSVMVVWTTFTFETSPKAEMTTLRIGVDMLDFDVLDLRECESVGFFLTLVARIVRIVRSGPSLAFIKAFLVLDMAMLQYLGGGAQAGIEEEAFQEHSDGVLKPWLASLTYTKIQFRPQNVPMSILWLGVRPTLHPVSALSPHFPTLRIKVAAAAEMEIGIGQNGRPCGGLIRIAECV